MSKNSNFFYELNNSKFSLNFEKNLSVLENIDKTMIVKHISSLLRPPAQTSRQPQCNYCIECWVCLNVRAGSLRISAIWSTNVFLSIFSKTVKFVKIWRVVLKLNISKTTLQILINLTVLENIDKTMFVDHIADILRPPARTSRETLLSIQ